MMEAKKASATPKPPRKLVPRPAPATKAASGDAQPVLEAAPVSAPVVAPEVPVKSAGSARARKPSRVDETVARHQKSLAEALEKAQAIKYDHPAAVMKPEAAKGKKAAKPDKLPKAKKVKLIRDSYAMPEAEYARIAELKKRMQDLGAPVKKSELLRAGIAMLAGLMDSELKAVMGRVERIKTGRPAK